MILKCNAVMLNDARINLPRFTMKLHCILQWQSYILVYSIPLTLEEQAVNHEVAIAWDRSMFVPCIYKSLHDLSLLRWNHPNRKVLNQLTEQNITNIWIWFMYVDLHKPNPNFVYKSLHIHDCLFVFTISLTT